MYVSSGNRYFFSLLKFVFLVMEMLLPPVLIIFELGFEIVHVMGVINEYIS